MNKFYVALACLIFLLVGMVSGALGAAMLFNYGAQEAAMEVVQCMKDPESCQLDEEDVPDFSPDEKMVPVVFTPTEIQS